jgi:hypothetical protein
MEMSPMQPSMQATTQAPMQFGLLAATAPQPLAGSPIVLAPFDPSTLHHTAAAAAAAAAANAVANAAAAAGESTPPSLSRGTAHRAAWAAIEATSQPHPAHQQQQQEQQHQHQPDFSFAAAATTTSASPSLSAPSPTLLPSGSSAIPSHTHSHAHSSSTQMDPQAASLHVTLLFHRLSAFTTTPTPEAFLQLAECTPSTPPSAWASSSVLSQVGRC